jgi:hypothetical protein
MTHRLAILFALVRQHVENQQPARRDSTVRAALAELRVRFRHVMQNEKEKDDVQFCSINGVGFLQQIP